MPESRQHRVLLAVSDKASSGALRGYFRALGCVVKSAPATDLVAAARTFEPCFAVVEIQNGEHYLASLRSELPEISVFAIAFTADARFEAARCGVLTTIGEACSESEIASRLGNALETLSCDCNKAGLAVSGPASLFDLPSLFSSNSSPRMMEIRHVIDKVATTSATVLIRGESGVGKEIAARMIYRLSERRNKPFVKVACAAIPNDLLESELFGYEAGAFTGAHRSKPGKFDLADGGTVFLDEIAEMHPILQAKLLHVLQDGEFARLGSKRDTSVNVRVICATNRPLEAQVAEGLFREDLLYRINVVTVNIPPLRERRSEIPGLIHYFLKKYGTLYRRVVHPLDSQTMDAMISYLWPGNIRELENFCKRYAIMGDSSSMMRELQIRESADTGKDGNRSGHFPEQRLKNGHRESDSAETEIGSISTGSVPGRSLLEIGRQAAWHAEREAIETTLAATRWNRKEAARRLHVSYKALLNKIKMIEEKKYRKNGHSDPQ
jgi:two-component system, NtrC family, response regulator AtoC